MVRNHTEGRAVEQRNNGEKPGKSGKPRRANAKAVGSERTRGREAIHDCSDATNPPELKNREKREKPKGE
jgi:hypothetical protein